MTTEAADRAGSTPGIRLGLLILALSVAYAAAMFRGLESHSAYAGCAYQVLRPRSFPGDLFMPLHRPYLLSLYYFPLVKLAGPIWLDDRFTFFVFVGMAVISLVGLDRTVRLLGTSGLSERAALLCFVLLEHRFFINHVVLVDNYGFNAIALGAVVCIWLLYGALAGWGPARQLPLMALAFGISMKNTWIPMIIASVLLWKDRLGAASKRAALAAAALGVGGGLIAYYGWLRPSTGTDAALFDYVLNRIDDAEANPFLYPLWANLLFAVSCLSVFFLHGFPARVLHRIRTVAVIGLLTWLFSGLYLTYAPDPFKIPYLVPFDARRAMRWPSYALFVTWGVFLLKRIREATSRRGTVASALAFAALYLLHEDFRLKLAVLVAVVPIGVWLRHRFFSPGPWKSADRLRLVTLPVVIGTLSLYAVGALHHRRAALLHLVRTGIVGDNICAKWVGINEYFRDRTPPSATVLALSMEDSHRNPAPLQFDASLRTRTGRSMPLAHQAAFYLDYPKLQWWEERDRLMKEMVGAWEKEDPAAVAQRLSEFGPPDYLVVPTVKSGWAEQASGLGYRVETRIGGFTLFRRNA